MQRPLLPLTLLAAGVVLAGAAAPIAPEVLLKDNEHDKLAKVVSAYWTALRESKGVHEAFADVQEEVDKQAKKLKGLPDGDLLATVDDWERILFRATEVEDREAKWGKVEDRTYKDPNLGEYTMAVSSPKKRAAGLPLVICIPPKGKKAKDHLAEEWTALEKREAYVMAACDMPTNDRMWSEIGREAGNHGGIDTVLLTLRSVRGSHGVDVDRVFLAGFGEGVQAAIDIAALYPHVFAGVIGRAGDVGDVDPTNLRNVPSFFAGGGEKTTAYQAAAKELGIENVTLSAGATEADVWAWIEGKTRVSNPLDVSLAPKAEYNSRAYWLYAEGFDPASGPKLRAVVDRESNTITIDGEGVTKATVYFNDEIVDLSKPVKVICNGQANEDLIPRKLKSMLDLVYYGFADPGRVYVNAHSYDLPLVDK